MFQHLKHCLFLLCLLGLTQQASAFDFDDSRVYTMSNAAEGNEIIQYWHTAEGLVEHNRRFRTGGSGSGGGLGNQGALQVNADAYLLFAVNAGSDSISVFRIRPRGLTLIDVVHSRGSRPVSLTQHGEYLYVLNAGSDNIAGFRINARGKLQFMPYSVRPLSGMGSGAAQISFTPTGDALIVTEKATNLISTFTVDTSGLPGHTIVNASAGQTPFGFGFDRYGHLLVTEAAGGATDASSVSSYEVLKDGSLALLDAVVPTTESAACWLVTTRDGRVAFTTNTASSSISAFEIDADGSLYLTETDGVAASTGTGSGPIDLITSRSGRYLYALSSRNGSILSYEIVNDERLVAIDQIMMVPTSANGLAAF